MKGPLASAHRTLMFSRLLLTGFLLASALVASPVVTAAAPLGANKFDLLLQYEGYSDFTDRSDAYRHVTRAMARKAILDAKDAGFAFLRVSVSGFGGSDPRSAQRDMLKLWQSDPATYWRRVDEMFDDIDKVNLQIVPTLLWNYTQFPALTGETTTDLIHNPSSASRALASRYIQDFVTRYRERKTILFLELTNEFNLHAGMDVHRHCVEKNPDPARCVSIGNFSQDDLNNFAHDMVGLLHRLDAAHQISSGYAVPPPWAYHMALRPEWNKPAGFVADSREDFDSNLATLHRDYDIVSIHIYPANAAVRFTRPQGSQADLIADAANVAHGLHKKLFVGEFGDTGGATPFMQSVKALLDNNTVDYAAVWAWEFYQTSTFETLNTPPTQFNIEPGFRDDVVGLLRRAPLTPDSSPSLRIVLTWPLPCSHVGRPMQISAVAADGDRPVSNVEFQVDGASIGSVATPPYRLTWDPAGKTAHTAQIKVIAHAQSKSTAADSADILLNGANDACKVTVE